jgi:catecholate siderophore receptor
MSTRIVISIAAILVLLFVPLVGIFAADGNGPVLYRIRGRVVDQNQAIIPGAKVTVVGIGKSQGQTVSTDSEGEFDLMLEPGEYRLAVEASGFSQQSQKIVVGANDTAPIEMVLLVAENSVTVTVSDAGAYQPELISSATKTYTPLINVPQSISITTKQQITDQMMSSIGDVVRYVPGVTAHQGENNRDQVILRGQSSSADFYVNGVRDDVQYYRDLYNLNSVEVLKGPNAMIFGRGGGGGVINRVSKTAGFIPVREFLFQGGSYGDARASADVDQPINSKLAVRGNAFFERSGSFRKGVDLSRQGFNPTLTFNPDAKSSFTLSYEFFRDRRTADRGITSLDGHPVDVPRSTFYGNADDSRVRANVHLLTGTFDRQFGHLLMHNRTVYGDYDRYYQNYVPGAVSSGRSTVALSAYNNATHRRNLFSQTDLSYTANTGLLKHTILGGFELGRQRSDNCRNTGYFSNTVTSIQVAFNEPATTIPVTFRQSATDADNRVRVNLAAAYLQDQVELSRYLQLVGGVRFDYFDMNFHNNRNSAELRRIDRLVSPRFGVVLKPFTELSLYGNYSVSYLPSSGDQFSSLTVDSQTMKPEKFTNYEAGIKWDVRPGLSLTAAAYRLDRTNTKANDPNMPGLIVQTGIQRTNGFEAGLSGSVTRSWTIAGGYAYQDAFISSPTTNAILGARVAQVPHHSFSVWNKYQLSRRVGAGLGLIRRSDMFASIDNTVVLPAYTRADAAVYYSINEHWRLQANFENIFNTKYFQNADNNTNISPGAPVTAKVGLVARF